MMPVPSISIVLLSAQTQEKNRENNKTIPKPIKNLFRRFVFSLYTKK